MGFVRDILGYGIIAFELKEMRNQKRKQNNLGTTLLLIK
jgi:hypothetical protein